MKGDFSRFTFDSSKHYRGVMMQQGRVQLDADWNEHAADGAEVIQRIVQDVVGCCGVPIQQDAFAISPHAVPDFTIAGGRMYVGGHLVELDEETTYFTQPDYPEAPDYCEHVPVNTQETFLIYMDTWTRMIGTIEDPQIQEIALGGPDTAQRLKQVAQVKVLAVGDDTALRCSVPLSPVGGGLLKVDRTVPLILPNPCAPLAQGGFQGTENRLYRVEVHAGGDLGTATFKWSRDNASVTAAICKFESDTTLRIMNLRLDDYCRFRKGDFVEVADDVVELSDSPAGKIYVITDIDIVQSIITLDAAIDVAMMNRNPQKYHAKIRRWDGGAAKLITDDNAFELEAGIKVRFGAGNGKFRIGDYWVFATRPADGSVQPMLNRLSPPMGPQHAYCALAMMTLKKNEDGTFSHQQERFNDCRHLFYPLRTKTPAIHILQTNWRNDDSFSINDFEAGLEFVFDIPPSTFSLSSGNIIVTAEISPNLGDKADAAERSMSASYVLHGECHIVSSAVTWKPAINSATFDNFKKLVRSGSTILIRVLLKGHTIFGIAGQTIMYLDGQAFGHTASRELSSPKAKSRMKKNQLGSPQSLRRIALQFPTGDNGRASDFESWFSLVDVDPTPAKYPQIKTVTFVKEKFPPYQVDARRKEPISLSSKENIYKIIVEFDMDVNGDTHSLGVVSIQPTSLSTPSARRFDWPDDPNGIIIDGTVEVEKRTGSFTTIQSKPFGKGKYLFVVVGEKHPGLPPIRANGYLLDGDFDDREGGDYKLPFEIT